MCITLLKYSISLFCKGFTFTLFLKTFTLIFLKKNFIDSFLNKKSTHKKNVCCEKNEKMEYDYQNKIKTLEEDYNLYK